MEHAVYHDVDYIINMIKSSELEIWSLQISSF
jgi:hypothetical protein